MSPPDGALVIGVNKCQLTLVNDSLPPVNVTHEITFKFMHYVMECYLGQIKFKHYVMKYHVDEIFSQQVLRYIFYH